MSADKYKQLMNDLKQANASDANKPINTDQDMLLFLKNQQDTVFQDVIKQQDASFDKAYGDLQQAVQTQELTTIYDKRNKDLANIQESIYNKQQKNADEVINANNMASRKNEMNEWTVQNKSDTLFVFSSLFITISALLLLTVLWKMHIIPASLWVGIGLPFILIFILIVVNRSQYTDILRNKRYWNKKIFDGKYGKIPLPSCEGALEGIESAFSSVESTIESGAQKALKGSVSALKTASEGIDKAADNL
jgi:hypothetical protein